MVMPGGTYLMGGDYNKAMDGWRDYEKTVLGPTETFVDNLKKLGLGFQFGGELLYELSPSISAGIEVGYLSPSFLFPLLNPGKNLLGA